MSLNGRLLMVGMMFEAQDFFPFQVFVFTDSRTPKKALQIECWRNLVENVMSLVSNDQLVLLFGDSHSFGLRLVLGNHVFRRQLRLLGP